MQIPHICKERYPETSWHIQLDKVQPLHQYRPMPTIQRLPNCTIALYAGDHLPPHFHVRLQDGREALVEIANLAVLSGRVSRRELAAALEWAAANQALLIAKWEELNP